MIYNLEQDVAKQVEQLKDAAAAALLATLSTDSPPESVISMQALSQSWQSYRQSCNASSEGYHLSSQHESACNVFTCELPVLPLAAERLCSSEASHS